MIPIHCCRLDNLISASTGRYDELSMTNDGGVVSFVWFIGDGVAIFDVVSGEIRLIVSTDL